jgi:hypothetical protein
MSAWSNCNSRSMLVGWLLKGAQTPDLHCVWLLCCLQAAALPPDASCEEMDEAELAALKDLSFLAW